MRETLKQAMDEFLTRGERDSLLQIKMSDLRRMVVADRVGSIEAGKDADLLILDGPPLDYRTYVDKALVGGKVYYDRAENPVYAPAGRR